MQTSLNLRPQRLVDIYLYKQIRKLFLLLFVFLFISCHKDDPGPDGDDRNCKEFKKEQKSDKYEKNAKPTVSVFASGFDNPRGLKFGPDCYLYVAEAGLGGTTNTSDICPEIQPSAAAGGPFLGSPTGGRISRVNAKGQRTTVTDKLPTSISTGGDILGVADVAFIGNKLYALLWAGCSHGVLGVPNGIVRINTNGTHTAIADIGAWQVANPVAVGNRGADFEPEGNPFTMIFVDNNFYIVEANQGQLLKATTGGTVTRVVDLSATQGHLVPTAIDYYQGNFYVGNLGAFPIVDGTSNIYKITPGGQISIAATGFTAILGLVFDKKGRFYVLETTTGKPFPTPATGRIIRVNQNGSKDIVATGLSNATAMTYGPDKNLYVSNWGFGASPGGGQVLKVVLND
ncbi:ScyD/ScyE family protein [Flavitalea sp.]|nr:ScyD/ScyE family protein [Flavitalea sp.]